MDDRVKVEIEVTPEAARALAEDDERIQDCRDDKDRDDQDNAYLEAALAAGADIIVTGDADLLVLDPWRGVRILQPADYVASVAGRPGRPG